MSGYVFEFRSASSDQTRRRRRRRRDARGVADKETNHSSAWEDQSRVLTTKKFLI